MCLVFRATTLRLQTVTVNIAMISEHASPLATIGGVDAGGQNIRSMADLHAAVAAGAALTTPAIAQAAR